MSFAVKACAALDELGAALGQIGQYLGFSPTPEFIERMARILPPERVIGAHERGVTIGGAASYALQLTIPGGRLAASALSFVGVAATHRRRGVLSAMMRAQLDVARERGEALAYLWASEDTIYGRFGFGLAAQMAEINLDRKHAAFRAEPSRIGAFRLVALDQAAPLVTSVYERVANATPGMLTRSPAWWETRLLTDHAWARGGGGPLQCVLYEDDAGPAAYALYRLNTRFEQGTNDGTTAVVEAIGASPEATCAIWRYLCDIDWLARVQAWRLPLDHPLHLLIDESRRLRFTVRDGTWVRLVDLEAALTARSYAASGSVVIDVTDSFCPWNAGNWAIGDGGARRTSAAAALACDVTALGSAYLGGFSWARLAAALRVTELKPGAITRADALFRTPQAPWCPEIF